jgi:hypothetical protein
MGEIPLPSAASIEVMERAGGGQQMTEFRVSSVSPQEGTGSESSHNNEINKINPRTISSYNHTLP